MPEPTARVSFASLNRKQRKYVLKFFSESPSAISHTTRDAIKTYVSRLGHTNGPLSIILALNSTSLLHTNPALFQFLTAAQRMALETDLQLAFYQLCAQYQFDEIEHRRQHLPRYFADIERCAFLIRNLRQIRLREEIEVVHSLRHAEHSKNWLKRKYQILHDFFADEFSAGKSVYVRQWMSDFNVWRSYWSWASLMTRAAIKLFPSNFYQIDQTTEVTTNPQHILGYISWLLYLIRFTINFALILKHTIKGPWMSDEEKKCIVDQGGIWNRFTQQLAQKKFLLINDLVWGTSNLLCFFWLVGPALGPAGDIMIVLLLIGDVFLGRYARHEAEEKHQKEMKIYDDEIARLTALVNQTDFMRAQLARLKEAREQCALSWLHGLKTFNADIQFNALLTLAYALTPLAEIGLQASATALMTASAFLCFGLVLVYASYKAYIEVEKAQSAKTTALEKCSQILFADGNMSEVDYIRYQDLKAEADYLDRMVRYQRYAFLRTMILRAVIPLALFSAFTFSTFGIGLAAIAVGLVLAIMAHLIIEHMKPPAPPESQFVQAEYLSFDRAGAKTSLMTKIDKANESSFLGLFAVKNPSGGITPRQAEPATVPALAPVPNSNASS
jgi:hypothetical protein